MLSLTPNGENLLRRLDEAKSWRGWRRRCWAHQFCQLIERGDQDGAMALAAKRLAVINQHNTTTVAQGQHALATSSRSGGDLAYRQAGVR